MSDGLRDYLIISPCRNEAVYMRRTLDSVVAQSEPPVLWVIVDDGSTDGSREILEDYAGKHDWIRIVYIRDRGYRAVGPGVIEAFYAGLETVSVVESPYIAKLDLDLDLPPRYFEILIDRMEADPRIGTCSGKPYVNRGSRLVSERRSDDMSAGMTKVWRRTCFEAIGGVVREVMWDAIDCHKARQLGWRAISWDEPELRFEHLRPMGSSQTSIYTGRRRHGYGQYFMGAEPLYFIATAVFRGLEPPYVLGSIAMLQGYLGAWWRGERQLDDPALRAFIRRYQRHVLLKGRTRAMEETDAAQAHLHQSSV